MVAKSCCLSVAVFYGNKVDDALFGTRGAVRSTLVLLTSPRLVVTQNNTVSTTHTIRSGVAEYILGHGDVSNLIRGQSALTNVTTPSTQN